MNIKTEVVRTIEIDRSLALADAEEIASGRSCVILSEAARTRCGGSFARLRQVIEEKRVVYGITTGFGPLANRFLDTGNATELQQNLVYHLATGGREQVNAAARRGRPHPEHSTLDRLRQGG